MGLGRSPFSISRCRFRLGSELGIEENSAWV
jgi:hypothetical protein